MNRKTFILNCQKARDNAVHWAKNVSHGSRVEFKAPKRSLPQNDHMWLLLTDVSKQHVHCGRKYSPDQWKVIFLHACGREVQFIPSIDGTTFIPWGQSSSDLSKKEMTDLIEYILWFGAQHGVRFYDEEKVA